MCERECVCVGGCNRVHSNVCLCVVCREFLGSLSASPLPVIKNALLRLGFPSKFCCKAKTLH